MSGPRIYARRAAILPINAVDYAPTAPPIRPTVAAASEASPILLTGAHRSGSTWVGRMLATGPDIAYLDEPFNLNHRPGSCAAEVPHWFTHVTAENEGPYVAAFANTLRLRYDVAAELKALRNPKDLVRMGRDWGRFLVYRAQRRRPLMKDPIAFFSAEWLAERFGMETVVLVRHPAAFVNSLCRVGWWHDFRHFTEQPLLMRGLLHPYEGVIRAHVGHEREDPIEHAALLWKIIYGAALTYRERHPGWLFVRHEDLSRHPATEFRQLFGRLGIPVTEKVEAAIRAHSNVENPAEAAEGVIHQLERNSLANVWTWADRLTPAQVAEVRYRVSPEAEAFYEEADWEPPVEQRGSRRSGV